MRCHWAVGGDGVDIGASSPVPPRQARTQRCGNILAPLRGQSRYLRSRRPGAAACGKVARARRHTEHTWRRHCRAAVRRHRGTAQAHCGPATAWQCRPGPDSVTHPGRLVGHFRLWRPDTDGSHDDAARARRARPRRATSTWAALHVGCKPRFEFRMVLWILLLDVDILIGVKKLGLGSGSGSRFPTSCYSAGGPEILWPVILQQRRMSL